MLENIVILGHGVMGAGSAALFASHGLPTTLVARTREKALAGKAHAEKLAKRPLAIEVATYDDLPPADFILEAISEQLAVKRALFAMLDELPGAPIVASVSSGLSITEMCAGRSPAFQARFSGVHLFNPPTHIVGCELIAHSLTSEPTLDAVRALLRRVKRQVVETADTPGFAGNRVGFRLLNHVAQLAEEHGVAFMDALVGPHTGRALAPLATIDLVGWDVHAAICDHLYAHTGDPVFVVPGYMRRGIERGHLGRKTRELGGFYRIDAAKQQHVLDPGSAEYEPKPSVTPAQIGRMQGAPDLEALMRMIATDPSHEASLLRSVLLSYVSHAMGLVGEVVSEPSDIDRIMGYGFAWASPTQLVEAVGAAQMIALLEREGLAIPPALDAVAQAA